MAHTDVGCPFQTQAPNTLTIPKIRWRTAISLKLADSAPAEIVSFGEIASEFATQRIGDVGWVRKRVRRSVYWVTIASTTPAATSSGKSSVKMAGYFFALRKICRSAVRL